MRFWVLQSKFDAIRFVIFAAIFGSVLSAVATSHALKTLANPSPTILILASSLASGLTILMTTGLVTAHIHRVQKKRDELEAQAHLDSLTGLLNRRAFRDAAAREQNRMERQQSKACLVLFDIDHFKSVNDEYGHGAGDLVLKAISESLNKSIRPSMDYAGRWGGEEFILLLAGTELKGANRAAERLRKSLENLFPSIGDKRISITASFGVTPFYIGQSLDEAIKCADQCLYEAKNNGRNRVVSTTPKDLRVVA